MRRLLIFSAILLLIGIALAAYYVFQPHRNVSISPIDHSMTAQQLVDEYLNDAKMANSKYLANDGVSKILALEGNVAQIKVSADGRTIVVLKEKDGNAGIQCLFKLAGGGKHLNVGDHVAIKGVLRAGPGYDDDLEMFENGYLEECSLLE